MCDVVGAVS